MILILPAPSPVSKLSLLPVFLCVVGRAYRRERRGRGWGRSQIIRRRESLVLYKSFNPLVLTYTRKARVLFHNNDDLQKCHCICSLLPIFFQNRSNIFDTKSNTEKKHLLYNFEATIYFHFLAEVKNISKRQDITLPFH
jgi:hypothetical protein